MPIYRYRCEDCEDVMEVLAKPSDEKPSACKSCGSTKLSKVMSRTSFQLRGGGWYAEGYAQSGSAKGASSSAATETKPSGASSADTSSSAGGSSAKSED